MGTIRWIYNMCINLENHDVLTLRGHANENKKKLRNCFSSPETIQEMMKNLQIRGYKMRHANEKNQEEKKKQRPYLWIFNTPAKLRDEAISDFLKNRKSSKASVKEIQKRGKQKLSSPKLKFRSLKQFQQSIPVPCQDWNLAKLSNEKKNVSQSETRKKLKPKKVKDYSTCSEVPRASLKELCAPGCVLPISQHEMEQNMPETLIYDSRLVRTRDRKYYLCIPRFMLPRSENQAPAANPYGIIALDPGVRTFLTGYDPSGIVLKWGNNDMIRICKLAIHYDKIQSRCADLTREHHQRYKLRKAGRKIQEKIRNLIHEIHKKVAIYLCENYRVILLPEFNVSQMMKRFNRRISRKTVRQMVTWSHYKFRHYLLYKQTFYPWCKVIICDEAYTSKTCGNCGFIHNKLGGAKEFKCPNCKYYGDRDIHASRNILLRYLTLWNNENLADQNAIKKNIEVLPEINL